MKFICDTCGKEVTPEEGTLSWVDDRHLLDCFRITHKNDQNHSCDPRHVAYIHLWIVTGISGFGKFAGLLAELWGKEYALKDADGLKAALGKISCFIWEKSNPDI